MNIKVLKDTTYGIGVKFESSEGSVVNGVFNWLAVWWASETATLEKNSLRESGETVLLIP